jgi:membrane fusion protein (multidrug efflux system)
MYVRVQIEQGIERGAVLVPQQAVQRDASGSALVYVVSADNKAGPRPVRIGRAADTRWVITDGLKDGEKIIVEGFQKVQPGAEVVPSEWDPNAVAADAQKQATEGGDAKPADAKAGDAKADEAGKAEGGDAAKTEQAK